jgi:hypothetical protein
VKAHEQHTVRKHDRRESFRIDAPATKTCFKTCFVLASINMISALIAPEQKKQSVTLVARLCAALDLYLTMRIPTPARLLYEARAPRSSHRAKTGLCGFRSNSALPRADNSAFLANTGF